MPLSNPVILYAAKLTFWKIFSLHLFMKLKVTPLYILSFLFLVFLVHEVHDWAHTLAARISCTCWGSRIFDGWDFCAGCSVSSGERALATIAGPLINYVLLLVGWDKLHPENTVEEKSVGVSLVFACLPLNLLMGAVSGGGDLTDAIQLLQVHRSLSVHAVHVVGLLLTLILTVPPIIRAFVQLPGYQGKLIVFPVLLLVPGWLDRELVGKLLNKWLIPAGTPQSHAYAWVIGWGVLVLVGWLFTRHRTQDLINELSI
jgi:hypothetical protein